MTFAELTEIEPHAARCNACQNIFLTLPTMTREGLRVLAASADAARDVPDANDTFRDHHEAIFTMVIHEQQRRRDAR